jgi:hypothetical protein
VRKNICGPFLSPLLHVGRGIGEKRGQRQSRGKEGGNGDAKEGRKREKREREGKVKEGERISVREG